MTSEIVPTMSFVIWFADKSCQIREEFIQFLGCESGQELFLKIVNVVRDLRLGIGHLRGQGYDGAGNMAGKKSGVSSRILRLNDNAWYVHCFYHQYNLVIAKSCNIQKSVKFNGYYHRNIFFFFNLSPKRQQFLKDVKKLSDADTTKETLIHVCITRWVAGIDGLEVFETCFTIIVYVIEKMKDNENLDIHFNDGTSTKASNSYKSCYNFDFVVVLVTRSILYTSAVTELLQKYLMIYYKHIN